MGAAGAILAVDPGKDKCGVALVADDGQILFRRVVPSASLGHWVQHLTGQHPVRAVVVGGGTYSQPIRRLLEGLQAVRAAGGLRVVEEAGSSGEARRLYWRLHPPRGLWRLIPVGLRVPPEPWDDLAAVVLARRFLQGQAP